MATLPTSPPPPRWVILDRVALVSQDGDDAEGPRRGVTASLAAPPRVSRLTVPTSVHPDPKEHDKRPYLVAADPDAGILVNLAKGPATGLEIAVQPQQPKSSLVLVRDFLLPADAGQGGDALTATGSNAVHIPDRIEPPGRPPRISSIKSVGLVSLPGGPNADYAVAELRVDAGVNHAKLLCFLSSVAAWEEKLLERLHMPGRTALHWGWATDDVVGHDGKLWWVSLRRGILSCSPFEDRPVLRLDELPETVAEERQFKSTRHIEADRCVKASRGRLRYVEIVRAAADPVGATLVVMWTLITGDPEGFTWWKVRYGLILEKIWSSDSYTATGMPREVPMLAIVSPTNPDLLYFFLEEYLFVIDAVESNVVEFVRGGYILSETMVDSVQPAAISWRYILAWELPSSVSKDHDEILPRHYRWESLIIRNETSQLRRTEYELKIRGDSLKRLEEGLLHRDEENSSWNKIQIVLLAVLISGLSVLFQFWPWLPLEFLRPIVFAFGCIWVLGCVALPFVLFGA